MPLQLLFVSTPIAPLGSGLGGGVELTVLNLAKALQGKLHQVEILAPEGSQLAELETLGIALIEEPGQLQSTAQNQGRRDEIRMPGNGVLGNLWVRAQRIQANYDLILNFAYDWLPLYLTPFFTTPVAHLISMGSLTDAMDTVISAIAQQYPDQIAFHSKAQADTFAFGDRHPILYNGFDLSQYQFQPQPSQPPQLGWVGRIAPEKGLEDAIAAAQQLQRPLKIWGALEHPDYWEMLQRRYPRAPLQYGGFLPTADLQQQLGLCQGLIMTPKWLEAFGNVAIEALACGVPVVAYARGGPAEIVRDGETGWLVEPDSVAGLGTAIAKLDQIDRHRCRQEAESRYSLKAMGERVEAWLQPLLPGRQNSPCRDPGD